MDTKLKGNLWKIYIFKFLSEFYLIVPVLIPYYMSHGLNSTQVFTVQATYALAVLIFEIPSGYMADIVGRKRTLILGAVFLPVGLAVYVMGKSFAIFVLAEFILALGNSMRSGCESAIIYDTLIQLNQEDDYKKFEGRAFFYTRIGTSLSSVLGGALAVFSFAIPFYVNIITSLAMLPLALLLVEPERRKLAAPNPLADILKITKYALTHPRIRFFMLYSAMIMSTGIVGVWSYFLYYESLGINLGYFGIIFAVFQLSSAVGSAKAHSLEKLIGKQRSLFMILIMAPMFIILGSMKSIVLIPMIFFMAFVWGFSFPVIMDHVNKLITSDVRATILSVQNMAGSFSYVILAPLFGKLVDASSLSTAHISLGFYFLIYGLLALWYYFTSASR